MYLLKLLKKIFVIYFFVVSVFLVLQGTAKTTKKDSSKSATYGQQWTVEEQVSLELWIIKREREDEEAIVVADLFPCLTRPKY